MLKNTQSKIVLIFILTGLIVISALGIFCLNSVNYLSESIPINEISVLNSNIKIALSACIITFIVISIIIDIVLSKKYVIFPLNKLLKSVFL